MTDAAGSPGPTVIEVRDLHKRFRMPGHRPDTLKERAIHPFRKPSDRELKVLEGISFDVGQGEFFGIVGRNGCGKSTLLKLLASIYRPNRGTIQVAGRVASVIELGVGFQPELAALDNVILNCMMMGMTAGEARERFDEVIEFADLQDFVDMKLKNYSSGMRVRLAFATMLQSDPDILLLDEVLAVGDRQFQAKCQKVFREFQKMQHKTIVLVSNQLETLAMYCDRVMALEGGKVAAIGTPEEVSRADALQPEPAQDEGADQSAGGGEYRPARITDLQLDGTHGSTNGGRGGGYLEPGEQLRLRVAVEPRERISRPGLRIQIRDESNATVFFPPSIELVDSGPASPSDPLTIEAEIENRLAPGRYYIFCALTDHSEEAAVDASDPAHVLFEVGSSGVPVHGLVSLEHRVRVAGRPSGEQRGRGTHEERSG